MGQLVNKASALEIVPSPALKAEQLLKELGYDRAAQARGRMVIPIGHFHITLEFLLVKKEAKSQFSQRNILPAAFGPFIGKLNTDGYQE